MFWYIDDSKKSWLHLLEHGRLFFWEKVSVGYEDELSSSLEEYAKQIFSAKSDLVAIEEAMEVQIFCEDDCYNCVRKEGW